MHFTPKLNLSRFKKGMQGTIDFAVLIEQADPSQREKIIEQAEEQDTEFIYKVMKKVVFFEELVFLDDGILAEIISKSTAKVLAYALNASSEEFRKKLLTFVGHKELKQFQDEEDKLGKQISPALVLGGQRQILKLARTLEAQNKFVFELTSCPRFKQKRKRDPEKPTKTLLPESARKVAK